MVPISWCEMQCPKTRAKEYRKVAKVQQASSGWCFNEPTTFNPKWPCHGQREGDIWEQDYFIEGCKTENGCKINNFFIIMTFYMFPVYHFKMFVFIIFFPQKCPLNHPLPLALSYGSRIYSSNSSGRCMTLVFYFWFCILSFMCFSELRIAFCKIYWTPNF